MTETTETTETVTPATEPEFEPIASQEDFDNRTKDRIAREVKRITAKYPNYEQYKSDSAKLKSLEAASMTDKEKDAARIRELETELERRELRFADERRAIIRKAVADAKDVPENTITGDTREEMEASADELLAWRGKPKPRGPVAIPAGGSGASNTVGTGDPRRDKMELGAMMLRQYYGTGGPGRR